MTPGGEPVIKVAIVKMLSLPEYAALEATEAEGNPGCLTVKATSLRAWLTEQQQEEHQTAGREEEADPNDGSKASAPSRAYALNEHFPDRAGDQAGSMGEGACD